MKISALMYTRHIVRGKPFFFNIAGFFKWKCGTRETTACAQLPAHEGRSSPPLTQPRLCGLWALLQGVPGQTCTGRWVCRRAWECILWVARRE